MVQAWKNGLILIQVSGARKRKKRPVLFATCCWKIWTWRNQRVREEGRELPGNAVMEVRQYVANYFQRWNNEEYNVPKERRLSHGQLGRNLHKVGVK